MLATRVNRTRVLIVDDQEIVREAFAMLLSGDPTLEVVGTSADGEAAVEMASALRPDVVVMDVRMPRLNGVDAARRMREWDPDIGVILLSAYLDYPSIRDFLGDDRRGKSYLLKNTLGATDELVRTVHTVAAGGAVLDPIIEDGLSSQNDGSNRALDTLTTRELEVLELMAEARTNNSIASNLNIQPRTVEHHISSIFSKLGFAPDMGHHPRVHAVLAYFSAQSGSG